MDPAHKWDLDTCRGKGSWLYHEILSYCPTTTYTVILRYTYNCAISLLPVSGVWIRSAAQRRMNVIYNIGDAVNKIGFGLIVWNLAKRAK